MQQNKASCLIYANWTKNIMTWQDNRISLKSRSESISTISKHKAFSYGIENTIKTCYRIKQIFFISTWVNGRNVGEYFLSGTGLFIYATYTNLSSLSIDFFLCHICLHALFSQWFFVLIHFCCLLYFDFWAVKLPIIARQWLLLIIL